MFLDIAKRSRRIWHAVVVMTTRPALDTPELSLDELQNPPRGAQTDRFAKPIGILILSREGPQTVTSIHWDVIEDGAAFATASSKVSGDCAFSAKRWLCFAEIGISQGC